jgi:hypothetical protein
MGAYNATNASNMTKNSITEWDGAAFAYLSHLQPQIHLGNCIPLPLYSFYSIH